MTKLIRGIINLAKSFPPCVATIGNFDGVHLGHQVLLKQLKQKSLALKLPSVVITFEPQPNEYFAKKIVTPRLMRLREKIMAITKLEIDYILSLRFDEALAKLTPEAFIEGILVDALQVRYLLIGDDFRFGYKRSGDIHVLKQESERLGFSVDAMDTYLINGERVSSSRVREALGQGDLKLAEQLLGRLYGIAGKVAHGDKRGRVIGFPTANLFLHRRAVPVSGVFAVKVFGLSAGPIYGVANIGNRPTVGGTRSLLEVHLFDFNQDIYGKHIYVEFIHKLRDERHFESFELLREQILKDAEVAYELCKGIVK